MVFVTQDKVQPSEQKGVSVATQRFKRLRSQKEIREYKPVCTKKRQIGTVHHVEAHIPKKLYALPNHYTDLLVNAISAGRERAKQVLTQKTLVRPSDFLEEQTFFQTSLSEILRCFICSWPPSSSTWD